MRVFSFFQVVSQAHESISTLAGYGVWKTIPFLTHVS